jgi:hypothetical protein
VNNYNGQLLTGAGFASGCVVKERVVVTAAHAIFDDLALCYVTDARWFFQRQAGQYEPPQQRPRGSYPLGGYAAARSNDVRILRLTPGTESPASEAQDVAALFFFEDAGRGGQSGYLIANDSPGAQWLQSGLPMTLMGYPVENVSDSARGQLFGTPPTSYNFNQVPGGNSAFSTTNITAYPGMSGGPLCVQYQGFYYPAGVFLGGSQQTVVRAFDGSVADIINRADVAGNTGDNNTGGGVITFVPVPSGSATVGFVQVSLGPPAAVAAGAGWRLVGDPSNFSSDPNLTYAVTSAFSLEFKQIQGWSLPASGAVPVTLGSLTNVPALYSKISLTPSVPSVTGSFRMTLNGGTGRVYSIQVSTNLRTASSNWFELLRLTNMVGQTNFVDQATGAQRFYRALELP